MIILLLMIGAIAIAPSISAQDDGWVGGQLPELIPIQGLVTVTEKMIDFSLYYDQQAWLNGVFSFLYDDSLNYTPPNLSAPLRGALILLIRV